MPLWRRRRSAADGSSLPASGEGDTFFHRPSETQATTAQTSLHIGVVHAGRGYLQENLVRFGDRLRDILIGNDFWAAKGVDAYRFHDWSFACLCFSAQAVGDSAETSREPAVLMSRCST